MKEKNDYPNPAKQKQLYNDATNMFKEFARQEEVDELICLVQDDKLVFQFNELLYNMKHNNNTKNKPKTYAV